VPDWFAGLARDLLGALETQQLPALGLYLTLEGTGVPLPIPAEAVMVVLGLQVARGQAHTVVVMAIAVGAAVAGNALLYGIARRVGRPLLLRYGRRLRIGPERLQWLERTLARRALPFVAAVRVLPAVRILIPVAAGVARVDFRRFLVAAAVGNLAWGVLCLGLGWSLSDLAESALRALVTSPPLAIGTAAFVGVLALASVAYWLRRRLVPRARA